MKRFANANISPVEGNVRLVLRVFTVFGSTLNLCLKNRLKKHNIKIKLRNESLRVLNVTPL